MDQSDSRSRHAEWVTGETLTVFARVGVLVRREDQQSPLRAGYATRPVLITDRTTLVAAGRRRLCHGGASMGTWRDAGRIIRLANDGTATMQSSRQMSPQKPDNAEQGSQNVLG